MSILAKIERIASLLEQCILYNSPTYRPFSDQSGLVTLEHAESDSMPSKNPVSSAKEAVDNKAVLDFETAIVNAGSLFNVDLNFDLPLERYLTHLTFPRNRTTNRRVSCKCKTESKHCRSSLYARRVKNREYMITDNKSAKLVKIEKLRTSPAATTFLTLPGEVREAIYAEIFANARVYVCMKPVCTHAFDHHPAIRLTSKAIRAETSRAYFKSLTVKLVYQSLRAADTIDARNSIPDQVLGKIESLVVMGREFEPTELVEWKLKSMISLRTLTVIETGRLDFIQSNQLEGCLDKVIKEAKTRTIPGPGHWLSAVLQQDKRPYLVKWEKEDLRYYNVDRASHMGSLSKHKYSTVVISYSEDRKDTINKIALSISEIRARKEIYYWMSKRSKDKTRANSGTDAATIIEWLDKVEYHAILDGIEAGVTKTMDKAALVNNNDKPTNNE